jgi:hypothetical protein
MQIKAHDVGRLRGKLGVGADAPTAAPLQMKALAAQHPPDLIPGDSAINDFEIPSRYCLAGRHTADHAKLTGAARETFLRNLGSPGRMVFRIAPERYSSRNERTAARAYASTQGMPSNYR